MTTTGSRDVTDPSAVGVAWPIRPRRPGTATATAGLGGCVLFLVIGVALVLLTLLLPARSATPAGLLRWPARH